MTDEQSYRYRMLLETAGAVIVGLTPDYRIMEWNRVAEALFGLKRKEALGKDYLALCLPEAVRPVVVDEIRKVLQGIATKDFVNPVRARDGSERIVLWNATRLLDPTNKPVGLIAVGVDITEREQREKQFQLAVESSPSGMLMADQSGRIMLVNEQVEQQFGYGREELIGQPVEILMPERYRAQHPEHRARFFAAPGARRMGRGRDLFGQRKDGSEFPVEIGLNPIRTEEGDRVLASIVDITERKRAEDQFRQAVESSPSGMLMADQSGKIVLVNEQVERQFGYSRQELIGQSVEILLPERYRTQHPEDRARFFAAPVTRQMGRGRALFGQRKDGTEFPVEIGLNPIRTAEGDRVLHSIVDMTERKQIEEQLRFTERLAELGTLASGMAHEIGTPMSVILGRAEYLMHRTGDETTKKGLSTIVTQVERITKVMNQLLAIARRRPAERRAVNLRQTIEDSLEMFRERLARHRIRVEIAFADSVPLISADADQMSQVFLNLIMNAIHAMPDGGTLRVDGTQMNGSLRIKVTDTGHGISAEHISKVFDPFFTTKETGKGTGLGLTVVKGIIEEHGGTITVESEPGRGTTFTFTLPLGASSSQ